MHETPQFMELSIPCRDVVESLAWYRRLGFAELTTGDIRAHHYAVVTDGAFCIGLHADGHTAAGLSFTRPNLAQFVRDAQRGGVMFDLQRLGEDEFHEACQTDPDGTRAILLEARTFSAAMSAGGNSTVDMPLTGAMSHIALPCMRRKESLEFWQHFGFIAVEADATGTTELHTPGLVAHLREGTRQIELHFVPADFKVSQSAAAATDSPITALQGAYGLTAPEGTRLIVRDSYSAN